LSYAIIFWDDVLVADSSRSAGDAWISGVSRRTDSAHWRIVWLLFFSVCINYIDRGLLSVSAPVIAKELALSPAEMGLLFSAFFWSYAAFQLGAGWLVDRYPVKWIYAGGYLVWSLSTAATGFLHRLGPLLGIRLVLGVGESVSYPACSQIIARNFPEAQRGRANALIDVGSKIGPGLSMLVGGLLVAQFGWRALFIWVGFGSLLWLVPWILHVPGSEQESPRDDLVAAPMRSDGGPSFLDVLRRRELWGTSVGMFSLGYVWYFLLSWLPTYLVNARGFSLERMAVLGSLPFWVMAAGSICGGWGADRWIARGASTTRVRKTFAIAGLLGCSVLIGPVATVESSTLSILLVAASSFALGLYTSNVWAITQTLAGPQAAGKWTGIQNALGNMGGVVSPAVTGFIVSGDGSFVPAFVAAAVVAVVGASSYLTLVGDVSPLQWPRESVRAAEV
jgi:MFS transporter, ACS family, D-galactonate transporter